MKQQKNKKEMTTVDALIEDYNSNKKVFNDIINTPSLSHQYLEGIYLKYSKNLEEYMTNNKRGLRLAGNKKYLNVPIDLFLAESRKYKEEIINELKGLKSKNNKNFFDNLFLTPLPDMPRVLLNTEKEKNDFQSAERLAVVMRTFEYTKALRDKGMFQYYQMKQEERQQMIYIMKKATGIIEDWWINKNKQLKFSRGLTKLKYGKYFKGLEVMDKFNKKLRSKILKKLISKLEEIRKRQLGYEKLKISKFNFQLCVSTNFSFKIMKRTIKLQRSFYTKKLFYGLDGQFLSGAKINKFLQSKNLRYNLNCDKNAINKISYIQQKFRDFLNQKKTKQNNKKQFSAKMKKIIIKSTKNNQLSLYKYFIRWMVENHRYTSNKRIIGLSLLNKGQNSNSKTKSYLPTYLSYLPSILLSKFTRRYRELFNILRNIQRKSKSINHIVTSVQRANQKTVFGKIKDKIAMNALYKAVIHSDIQGKKWKNFQLWNIKNILIHIFVCKLIKFAFSFSKKIFFKNIAKYKPYKKCNNNSIINTNNKNEIIVNHTHKVSIKQEKNLVKSKTNVVRGTTLHKNSSKKIKVK